MNYYVFTPRDQLKTAEMLDIIETVLTECFENSSSRINIPKSHYILILYEGDYITSENINAILSFKIIPSENSVKVYNVCVTKNNRGKRLSYLLFDIMENYIMGLEYNIRKYLLGVSAASPYYDITYRTYTNIGYQFHYQEYPLIHMIKNV